MENEGLLGMTVLRPYAGHSRYCICHRTPFTVVFRMLEINDERRRFVDDDKLDNNDSYYFNDMEDFSDHTLVQRREQRGM
jgi:hypothetical protein